MEKTVSSKMIYEGKILNLRRDEVELPDGSRACREVVGHSGAVAVVAPDGEGNVLLVRQFRYPFGEELLELPAGKLEPGEEPEQAALRELEEETGFRAGRLRFLGTQYPSVAYLEEKIHLFLAEDLTPGRQHLDEGEFLSVERLPVGEAVRRVLAGELRDSKTCVGVLWYKLLLEGNESLQNGAVENPFSGNFLSRRWESAGEKGL